FISFPLVNQILPATNLTTLLLSFKSLIILLSVIIFGSLVAAIYPALILSSYNPAKVLKGSFKSTKSGIKLRKVLIVLQCAVSIFLITGLFTVLSQIKYMQGQELGMDTNKVVVISRPTLNNSMLSIDVLRKQLLLNSEINSFAASNSVPGREIRWENQIGLLGTDEAELKPSKSIFIRDEMIETLGLKLIYGREFVNSTSDTVSVIINEFAMKSLGITDPDQILNQEIFINSNTRRRVVGIIEDYHHESLKEEIKPVVMLTRPSGFDYFIIKLKNNDIQNQLEDIQSVYNSLYPNNPFNFFFLDDHFNQSYQTEINFSKAFSFFSGIAILISLMGLYGLASFITNQRKKEIGIRKVVGASSMNVLTKLGGEFIVLIVCSFLISCPIALYWSNNWLLSFPYR
ncbi:MAG: FtsX-like permease family protein, partial [Balneola sp.]